MSEDEKLKTLFAKMQDIANRIELLENTMEPPQKSRNNGDEKDRPLSVGRNEERVINGC